MYVSILFLTKRWFTRLAMLLKCTRRRERNECGTGTTAGKSSFDSQENSISATVTYSYEWRGDPYEAANWYLSIDGEVYGNVALSGGAQGTASSGAPGVNDSAYAASYTIGNNFYPQSPNTGQYTSTTPLFLSTGVYEVEAYISAYSKVATYPSASGAAISHATATVKAPSATAP